MSNSNENYFQISADILNSFPKYRLPLDLFVLREEIAVLEPYYRKGKRLTDAQVEEIAQYCKAGNLFVSQSDQKVYRQHMVQQVDLVLLDPNLKDSEIAELCIEAAVMRYQNYYEQPVAEPLELLYRDCMVITEYLWNDKHHIVPFLRRLFRKMAPAKHAVNTMSVGIWLWMQMHSEYARKDLDRALIALLLHDIGMSKVPDFIVAKKGKLTGDEWERVIQHPIQAVRIIQKSDLKFDELVRACFEHHERMDGSGYPQKSRDQQISLIGRVAAVADSFCAMISERSYAQAKEPSVAANELLGDARYDRSITTVLATAFLPGGPMAELVDMDSILEAALKK